MKRTRQSALRPTWLDLALLGVESQQVIWLRLMKLALGGPEAQTEATRMISEKSVAAIRASNMLLLGGTADNVVKQYRRVVRSNRRRLSK